MKLLVFVKHNGCEQMLVAFPKEERKNAPAVSLFRRKQGLGVPILVKVLSMLTNIKYYALLVTGGSIILPVLLILFWILATG